MKKLILSLLACARAWRTFAGPVAAAGDGIAWDKFPKERTTDLAALQNGAKLFVNYCLNCHAASYMRYNRMRDIGLTEEQIKDNLVFTGGKVGDLMTNAMDPKEAKAWFGAQPPDLTLVARSRSDAHKGSGADYLYTYLRTYYRDETKATGWNNLAFPNVGMPNPLWPLQGQQRAVFAEEKDPHDPSKTHARVQGLRADHCRARWTRSSSTPRVADLVAYMDWMSEPMQNQRVRLGVWVMLFLAVFTVIAWRLNAAFWKDIK